MRKITGTTTAFAAGLLVLAATVLLLWPGQGGAATCATAALDICNNAPSQNNDCDDDGFSDYLECTGFPAGTKSYSGFTNRGTGPRDQYLDPSGKDLFVAVARTVESDSDSIKQADLDNVAATLSSQLGVTVHYVATTDFVPNSNRQVTSSSTQKGLVIVENPVRSKNTVVGYTNPLQGTPNTETLTATVYTGRLEYYVDTTVCPVASYPKCVSNTGVGRQNANDTIGLPGLYAQYHRQNILHELSHALSLAPVTGSHYAVNTTSPFNNSVMSQYVYTKAYKATRTEPAKQVFYIPFTFDPSDAVFKLK